MKCQKCVKAACLHVTEILESKEIESLHLCEDCAHKFFSSQNAKHHPAHNAMQEVPEGDDTEAMNERACMHCGTRFIDFRNTGRLGCSHDYEVFRTELLPLLESIHGGSRHSGKTPRRPVAASGEPHREISRLRKELHSAVHSEAYEEAARLRDRIRILETG